MTVQITTGKLREDGINCVFNEDRLTRKEVKALLADEAKTIFDDSELIYETGNARSFRINVDNYSYFTKEYKKRKLYKRLLDTFAPACNLSFSAGLKLLESSLPTPTPILAAALESESGIRQILVTEYCENAMGLDQWIKVNKGAKREAALSEIACLLADFHSKGFYSRHLRSANILLSEYDGERVYWFIDLDRMCKSPFHTASNFISTVSRASFEFNEFLSPEERNLFLRSCFNSGLRHSIFRKPSQEKKFIKKALSQVKRRRGY